ncbi:MAG TPA: hypothetical protein GX711_04940, partial [Clostridia bacterium]|nr:hypothetical protein [Clostridia bacterium]
NGRIPPLYNRYRIIEAREDLEPLLAEIRLLNPTLNIEGYLTRPEIYRKHRRMVRDLSHYLWHGAELLDQPMARKERSFSIWSQEKFIDENGALLKEVLRFSGLQEGFLNYYDTPEPFFEYVHVRAKEMTVCIIENKDTWFSFRKLMQETGRHTFFGTVVNVLLYGEGNKITKKSALEEYAHRMLGSQSGTGNFLYFGDLDREGIRLFYRTKKANPHLKLDLFLDFYRLMLELATGRELPLSPDRRDVEVPLEEFIENFGRRERIQIRNILDGGRYLPQEIVNYRVLEGIIS